MENSSWGKIQGYGLDSEYIFAPVLDSDRI